MSDSFDPKDLKQLVEALKLEIQKLSDEIIKLDPYHFKRDSVLQENQALIQIVEDLKTKYYQLKKEEENLMRQLSAPTLLKIYDQDWPEPEKLEPGKSAKDEKKEPSGKK